MHISIITESKTVSVDGITLVLEELNLPEDLVAVHWFENKGWEERKNGNNISVNDINSINHYRSIIDAYNDAYAKIPEIMLPPTNFDLIYFVEDNLINTEIMKNSSEWEDFKIAMNRA